MNMYKTFGIVLLLAVYTQSQITIPYPIGNSCCLDNTIQVSGESKVSAQPDMAVIQIRFEEKGKTSADAVKALAAKVNKALAVLKANGYGADAVQTGSINVYPDYSYINGQSEIIGQKASQSLTIRIRGIDAKGQKVATLVDALGEINGINLDSVTFDIYDKTKLQTQARAKAFKDAKQKAQDYASFAGLNLGRVLTIDDSFSVQAPPLAYSRKVVAFGGAANQASTSVPVGEMDVTYSTTVTFSLR